MLPRLWGEQLVACGSTMALRWSTAWDATGGNVREQRFTQSEVERLILISIESASSAECHILPSTRQRNPFVAQNKYVKIEEPGHISVNQRFLLGLSLNHIPNVIEEPLVYPT